MCFRLLKSHNSHQLLPQNWLRCLPPLALLLSRQAAGLLQTSEPGPALCDTPAVVKPKPAAAQQQQAHKAEQQYTAQVINAGLHVSKVLHFCGLYDSLMTLHTISIVLHDQV